jgi:hypothetical protein
MMGLSALSKFQQKINLLLQVSAIRYIFNDEEDWWLIR